MHADEHVRTTGHLAVHQRDVLRPIHVVLVADDGELAEVGQGMRDAGTQRTAVAQHTRGLRDRALHVAHDL